MGHISHFQVRKGDLASANGAEPVIEPRVFCTVHMGLNLEHT